MPETRYEVVTLGIREGERVHEVKARLGKLVKGKNVNLDLIIEKAGLVIKRNLDWETAQKYRDAFRRAGIMSEVRRQDGAVEGMVCPNCGFRQSKAEACIRCGIIIEKFLKAREKSDEPREPQGPGMHFKKESRMSLENLLDTAKKVWSFRGGPVGVLIAALFIAYAIFETVFLGGDLVSSKRVVVTGPNNFLEFKVQEPDQEYLIRIYTGKKMKLSVRLVDSGGKVYHEDTEYAGHKSRSITFTPPHPGLYRVYVGLGPLNFSTYAKASVSVYINDKRVLTKILDRFKI